MDKEEFLKTGLLELYALGLTSPEESAEVSRYLRAYPELKSQLNQLKSSVDQYAQQTIPNLHLKGKKLIQISQQFAYYCLGGFVILLGLLFYSNNRITEKNTEIKKIQAAYSNCKGQMDSSKTNNELYAFLSHPKTKPLHLTGNSLVANNEILFYYNADLKKVMCNSSDLGDAPDNHQFQVWADIDGEMVNMGLIEDGKTSSLQGLIFHSDMESINITIEPRGGSVHPTVSRLIGSVPI